MDMGGNRMYYRLNRMNSTLFYNHRLSQEAMSLVYSSREELRHGLVKTSFLKCCL